MFRRKATKLRKPVSWDTNVEIQNHEYHHEARDSSSHILPLYVADSGWWWSSRQSKVAVRKSTFSITLIMVVSSLPDWFFDDLCTVKTLGKLVQCPFMVKLTMHVTMGGENMGFSWKPKLLTWLWRCRNWFQVDTASSTSSMVQNSKVRSLHGECDGWSFRNGQNPWREKGERLAKMGVVPRRSPERMVLPAFSNAQRRSEKEDGEEN